MDILKRQKMAAQAALDARIQAKLDKVKGRPPLHPPAVPSGRNIRERGIRGGLRLRTIRRSHKPEKKWDAVFEDDGKTFAVPFGQKGYSDYTKHHNPTRKQSYLRRHSGMGEHWNDPTTPGALAKWILWNKKTVKASVRDFKRRFHI